MLLFQPTGDGETVVKPRENRKSCDQIHDDVPDHMQPSPIRQGQKYDGKHKQDLQRRGELAVNAGRKLAVAGHNKDDRGRGEKDDVAAQHQRREPPANFPVESQHDKRRGKQQLIRDGIEIGAQRRPLVERAREQAVKGIRQSGNDENGKSQIVPPVVNGNDEKRQKSETKEGELIGNGEDAGRHFPLGFYFSSGKKREIIAQRTSDSLLESPGKRRDRAVRLVQRDSLDTLHGKK